MSDKLFGIPNCDNCRHSGVCKHKEPLEKAYYEARDAVLKIRDKYASKMPVLDAAMLSEKDLHWHWPNSVGVAVHCQYFE